MNAPLSLPQQESAFLARLGDRVRAWRATQRMTRKALAAASGVSERYLAQLEAGQGNISVLLLRKLARAMNVAVDSLVREEPEPAPRRIALLGLRGAGKSTVGAALAKRRGIEFVEVDVRIEETAGLRLSEIFELHGEAYYRRLEREVLTRVLTSGHATVLATGGSIVNDRDNYAILRERCTTVWLRARPEDHWNRVIQQGDRRPMAKNPHAYSELRALLTAREPLYSAADHIVDTSGRTVEQVLGAVESAIVAN
jgi:XRE family aerobic/anaerobic benzoate catabolism transcriptional regulator